MKEIEEAVNQFIQAIKESKTYKNYDMQRNLIKEDPELKAKIDEYREANFELQNSIGDNYDDQRMEEFAERYADFIEQPKVSAFLDAEVSFCKMIQEATDAVIDSVDFE